MRRGVRGERGGLDGQLEGGKEGWRDEGRCVVQQKTSHAGLPVRLRNEGKGHRHTHINAHSQTHTRGRAWPHG